MIDFIRAFLVVCAFASQLPQDAPFWYAPDEERRNATGAVTFAIVKDRAHYTARVFQNGAWMTYRYMPHTEKVIAVDAPGTSEEYLFDVHGQEEGIAVTVAGVRLAVRDTRDGTARLPGMEAVVAVRDRQKLHAAYRTKSGDVIASFAFSPKGHLQRVTLADRYRLDLTVPKDGYVTQTLLGPGDEVIRESVAAGIADRSAAVTGLCLDPFSNSLGLGDDWRSKVRVTRSASRSLITVTDSGGKLLLYVVAYGLDRFGFDPKGEALFYDLAPTFTDQTAYTGDSDVIDSVMPELSGVAPSRIVYGHDGTVGACVERASAGAIQSFWSSRDSAGKTSLSFRTFNGTAPQKKPSPGGSPRGDFGPHR